MAMNGISGINDVERIKAPYAVTYDPEKRVRDDERIQKTQEADKAAGEDLAHPDADSVTVGRSVDGDTSRASRAGLENLREGIVVKKGENAEERPGKELTSMVGYTDSQVEQLYNRGEISRQDYNEEMDRRERIEEVSGSGDDKDKNLVVESAKKEAEKEVKEDKNAARADDLKDADEKAAESRKQLITDEMENDRQFARVMGAVNAEQQNFSSKADAVMEAIRNDRSAQIRDILDAAENVASGSPTQ